jgi:hypothetical protein
VLFFLKRYREGCPLLEAALDAWYKGREFESYNNVLRYVYNSDEVPWHRCRVTLSHFYNRLGKDLREWRHWEAFVSGFHSKLFRLAGVKRDELLADSGRLPAFFDRLMAIRARRPGGNLIVSPSRVKQRQVARRKGARRRDERFQTERERRNARLREFFPEIRCLVK